MQAIKKISPIAPKPSIASSNDNDQETSNNETMPKSLVAPIKAKKIVPKTTVATKPVTKVLAKSMAAKDDDTASTLTNIEDIYQDKDLREHIYTLPDTYIGSIDPEENKMWVWNPIEEQMKQRDLTYIPGFYKIFDEILVNAIDQHVRMTEKIRYRDLIKEGKAQPNAEVVSGTVPFRPVKTIKIDVDVNENRITVENDGDGIDVEIHKKLGIYVPQMIFGKLLTSTNYQEDVRRIVGGKNGYGAKLTNIFSKEFVIETVDGYRKRRYRQVFRENMTIIEEPEIEEKYTKVPFTRISFVPDLARFKMPGGLDSDTVQIMRKRAYDTAACTSKDVTIYWNGQKLETKMFEKYVDLYIGTKSETKRWYAAPNERWEVCACPSPDHNFVQVSFVNGICTNRGGKHVEHVAQQICKKLADYINDKNKKDKVNVKTQHVKNNLWLFVRATIENPAFDTQTKECLTSKVTDFGSRCPIDDEFIAKLAKTGIVEKALALVQFKEKQLLKDTDGAKRSRINNAKLEEGKYVGGPKSSKCTLILTEGDSAKTFAMSGLKALDEDARRYYGVFPLRGKLLNVRDANVAQLSKNEEIRELKKIIGLQQGSTYLKDVQLQHLRYGSVMILTDQDVDGDHIKGLLINFFHHFWPSLLQRNTSIKSMITPLVKVWKMKKKGRRTVRDEDSIIDFYSEKDYNDWKKTHNDGKGWQYNYYKGLGTSKAEDARGCFENMKVVNYTWAPEAIEVEGAQVNVTDYAVNLAFKKGFEDSRKEWIKKYDPNAVYDFNITEETIADFINKRLINFSYEDCIRSLPSICDGLKVSQRKVMYGAFKKKLKSECKVAQFAGYVGEQTGYHHGEASLFGTIIGLAQNYVGSNNINLLYPSGQFGTRLGGKSTGGSSGSTFGIGKDSAAPRYIFTKMEDLTPFLFNQLDHRLYKYRRDGTQVIEPEYYLPILPMILINGSIGIGTGFSTTIPCFNPLHLIENIKLMIDGKPPAKMTPWYHGFKGEIYPKGTNTFTCHGVYKVLSATQLEVTELPINDTCFLEYKRFILSILDGTINLGKDGKEKKTKHSLSGKLVDADFDITDTTIRAVLKFAPNALQQLLSNKTKLEKDLKLVSNINCTNMHMFDCNGQIKKYSSPEAVLKEYYHLRVLYYGRRKDYLLKEYETDYQKASAKAQFIRDIHNGKIVINETVGGKTKPKKKEEIEAQLIVLKYPKFTRKTKLGDDEIVDDEEPETVDNNTTDNDVVGDLEGNYEYLLSLRIDSLTEEKIKELENDRDIALNKLEELKKKTPQMLWIDDLEDFREIYLEWLDDWYHEYNIEKPDMPIKLVKKIMNYKKAAPSPPKKVTIVKK